MKSILSLLLVFSFLTVVADASPASDEFFNAANSFFKKNVSDGKVDYKGIKSAPQELNALVKQIEGFSLSGKDDKTKMAFYINAYNISVINGIVANYPTAKPLDIAGFFDAKKHTVARESMTLNDLENNKLRAVYNDARVHFVLVCAAVGCPQLVHFAYTPERLEAQLQSRTKSSMNNSYFIRVKSAEKKVYVSEIFKWYAEDFTGGGQSVIQYINKFKSAKIPAGYTMDYYTYDWNLNELKK